VFVAAVIEGGDTVFGRRFDIAGDELTGEEAVAILSKVTGREVHYEAFPPDVLRAQSEDLALIALRSRLNQGSESRHTKARTGESVVNRLALDPRRQRVEAARLES
jgi:uncharacterized protein YbjT (DUF2867 family)